MKVLLLLLAVLTAAMLLTGARYSAAAESESAALPTVDAPAADTSLPLDQMPPEDQPVTERELDTTLSTLQSLVSLQRELREDVERLNQQATAAASAIEKQRLLARVEKLNADLASTTKSLQDIAAGADISSLRETETPPFDLQRELFSLLEPAIKEMKDMTSHVREKAELRDKITYYQGLLPITDQAVTNLNTLLAEAENETLQESLSEMLDTWTKQQTFLQSELRSAKLQFDKIEEAEVSIGQASQGYIKSFFQRRGLYLGQALLVVLLILLFSRVILSAMERFLPGYRRKHRPFQIRVLDLVHRFITVLLLILGPMAVFYANEDWLLFSIALLLLLGIALALREAIPRYWHQVQLFLNVGTVREGERVDLDGVPWLVEQINFYTQLANPSLNLTKRLKIDDLVEMRSRPVGRSEPWFPCQMDDWVLLNDGVRGKVVGLSPELVQLAQRGGTRRTYTIADFLENAPLNLSTNFRIKETIGVSYDLQEEAVSSIPVTLREHVEQRLKDDGYFDKVLNLRVEFEYANSSSLDVVVIVDFEGSLADLYNRLRRSIQKWCVEACTLHSWEIPFTQLTLNKPANPEAVMD